MGDEDTFTKEELEILGEAPVEPPAGDPAPPVTEEAAAPPADGEAPPAEGEEKPKEGEGELPADAKPAEQEHTEEEQKAVESMGARIEGGFIIDDEGTKIPITRWRKLYATSKEAERTAESNARMKTSKPSRSRTCRRVFLHVPGRGASRWVQPPAGGKAAGAAGPFRPGRAVP